MKIMHYIRLIFEKWIDNHEKFRYYMRKLNNNEWERKNNL